MLKAFLLLTLACITLTSCESFQSDRFISSEDFREEYKLSILEQFSIDDPSQPATFMSRDGVQFRFGANSFLSKDGIYNEQVTIDFAFIYQTRDMILSGMNTMYKSEDDKFKLLRTGGEFFIEATATESKELLEVTKEYEVHIPTSLTGGFVEGMEVFTLSNGESGEVFWLDPIPFGDGGPVVTRNENYYSLFFNERGWVNCDVFRELKGPLHPLEVNFPRELSPSNSIACIILDNYDFSLAGLNLAMPEGEPGKVLIISKSGNDYYIAYEKFEMSEGLIIDLTTRKLEIVSKSNIQQKIDDIIKL